jgi:hypothetical protein
MSISIRNIDDEPFEVTVSSSATTTHAVTITDEIHQKLTGGRISKEDLLDFSIKFLLDRELNTSIMGTFELTVISRYFPEYENEVRNSF